MIRVLRVARATAIRVRTQAINALHALVVSAPEELRERLGGLSVPRLVRSCAGFRLGSPVDPTEATKLALRSLAKRNLALRNEVHALDRELERLTVEAAPPLLVLFGVGPDTGGALLLAARRQPRAAAGEAFALSLTRIGFVAHARAPVSSRI